MQLIYLWTFILLYRTVASTIPLNPYIISEIDNTFNIELLKVDVSEFKENIMSRDFTKTYPINIAQMIHIHKQLYEGNIINILSNAFYTKYLPLHILKKYVDEFNMKSLHISRRIEKQCIDLMIELYSHNIYKSLRTINTNYHHKTVLDNDKDKKQIMQETTYSLFGTLASFTLSPITHDIITPVYMASNLGENIYNYFLIYNKEKNNKENKIYKENKNYKENNKKNNNKIYKDENDEIKLHNNNILHNPLSYEDIELINDKLFTFSKIYCMNVFNLQINLDMDNNNITLIGDKINYIWMINFINVLISNIEFKILDTQDLSKNDEKNNIIHQFTSYKQKLTVLKQIIHTLSDTLLFEIYASLNKQLIHPGLHTIENIKIMLNEKIYSLDTLSLQLEKYFPEFENYLEKTKTLIEERKKIEYIENIVKMFQQDIHNNKTYFEYNKFYNGFQNFKIITYSYVNIASNTIDMASDTVRNITRNFIGLITSIPVGFVEGVTHTIGDVIWNVVKNMYIYILSILVATYMLSFLYKTIFQYGNGK